MLKRDIVAALLQERTLGRMQPPRDKRYNLLLEKTGLVTELIWIIREYELDVMEEVCNGDLRHLHWLAGDMGCAIFNERCEITARLKIGDVLAKNQHPAVLDIFYRAFCIHLEDGPYRPITHIDSIIPEAIAQGFHASHASRQIEKCKYLAIRFPTLLTQMHDAVLVGSYIKSCMTELDITVTGFASPLDLRNREDSKRRLIDGKSRITFCYVQAVDMLRIQTLAKRKDPVCIRRCVADKKDAIIIHHNEEEFCLLKGNIKCVLKDDGFDAYLIFSDGKLSSAGSSMHHIVLVLTVFACFFLSKLCFWYTTQRAQE